MAFAEPKFFGISNIMNIIEFISVYGIMSCGMLFVVLIGGLDLSVGRMAALSGAVTCVISMAGHFSTFSMILGLLASIAVAVVFGLLHGFMVTKVGMPAFVVTLASSYLMYGLIPAICGGSRAYVKAGTLLDMISNYRVFEIQLASGKLFVFSLRSLIFIIFAVICWFILSKTTFGRRIYAIGGNPTAAEFVGIKVFKNTCAAYIICAIGASIGGLLLMSSASYAAQTIAAGYEGTVLMALIVGGINLAGGKGNISGAIFGALLVGIISNIVNLSSFLNSDYMKFFQGLIILIVVIISTMLEIRSRRGKGRKAKAIAEMQAEAEVEEAEAKEKEKEIE
ncbi:MAG: ABC transporter permease [Clostridiales Family XIII bacterium]|jgi:ribose/xylose/arabinose/galactoside ABC-type transport system permease subunit|nr:ABC transporter permease [Clostridiales Family XIII bacterium]